MAQAQARDMQTVVEQLVNMGFPEDRARKAAIVTLGSNAEAAASWLIDHGDEVDTIAVSEFGHEPSDRPLNMPSEEVSDGRPESDSFVFVNDELKLVLLVRKDLGMSPGKVAAQCSHATLGAYRTISETDPVIMSSWELAGEAVIVLGVENEEQMRELERKAHATGINTHIVRDAGRTEVAPSTVTVAALGPALVSKIDSITGHLALL